MKEEFIVYVWQFSLFDHKNLKTESNESIEILDKGSRNFDAGPDFNNAKIKIGNTIWAGNVEIHTNASDWILHKHSLDKAYDNVILHVVLSNDKHITRVDGEKIPTLALQNKILPTTALKWQQIKDSKTFIACEKSIDLVDDFTWLAWKERIIVERIEAKTALIKELLEQTKHDWNEAFYIYLAKSFGMKVNQQPFEMLAKSLPLKYIFKSANNLISVNALLFGQAGFLEDNFDEAYYQKLKTEYLHLKNKFSISPIPNQTWKFGRLRPANFPTIRITQLAFLIYKNQRLFSAILACKTVKEIYKLFEINLNDFWKNHYTFEKVSIVKEKNIGNTMLLSILINAIIPFLHLFATQTNQKLAINPLEILHELKPEINKITKGFTALNVESKSAFDSQALVHLHKNYCAKKQCLKCAVGNKILRKT